ncbi:hypothetical protein PCANC_11441 [Puccinia coronata f. sp. avenae]|uniref:Uncharacterized protein n=1 Tax=Puccinia coronata f. sp. avenae TaxID=200324 RepID=A0A2N5VCT8_9BASI|nr:hypothetical protein PCANC_11441 [Puccinia coronata f. sp. avenae]
MASIASSVIRSCRALHRGIRSTLTRPRMAAGLARDSPFLKALYPAHLPAAPPSTILSAFFPPLSRSSPAAGRVLALPSRSAPSAFRAFNLQPVLASPFRAFSGPASALPAGAAQNAAGQMARPAAACSAPLADQIVHDMVAARFAFPDPPVDP